MSDQVEPSLLAGVVRETKTIGPTHALGFDRLVGVHAHIRQGQPFDNMRLDLDFTCGIAPLKISNQDFEIALRTCFVGLTLQNSEVIVWSKYEHWLEMGAIEAREVKRTLTARSGEAGGNLNLSFDPLKGMVAIAAKLGLGSRRKRDASSESVTKQTPRIELVVTSGQNRWRVGDLTRGDARRPMASSAATISQRKDQQTAILCRCAGSAGLVKSCRWKY